MSILPPLAACTHRRSSTLATLLLVGALASPLEAQLELAPLWQVGQIEGPPETLWSRVTDAVTVEGVTYVVDFNIPAVRAFDQEGRFLREVGRQGAGPGEYGRPSTAVVAGDETWILDIMLKRVVVLDRGGGHLRTERVSHPPVGAVPWLRRHWPMKGGWYVGHTSLAKEGSTGAHYVLAWRDGAGLDTLATIAHTAFQERYELDDEHGRHVTDLILSTVGYIGPAGGMWPLTDSTFVVVDGERSTAKFYTAGPDEIVEYSTLEIPRTTTEPADSLAAVDWWYQRVGLDRDDPRVLEIVPPLPLPSWLQVLGGDSGDLWLLEGGPEALSIQSGPRWARWSPSSGEMTWLELPPGVTALSFTEGVVVGVRRDEWGVETIVAYRILEPR